ncbi:uncharacterized protein M421DRAFT_36278, partial [Didymella exigua CBS 183.55]
DLAHHKACLIEVVHVFILDAILGFDVGYQAKPALQNLRILTESSLLRRARYKAISPALANRLATAYSQQFISHICHLAQPGRKSSQVEVEYVLDDRLLF